ncbi:MAG: TIGR01777 family oxidoreductase [Desulfobacterota bacterium]|nr:TIGR01777 family oxidoreductase [Thermodesulfobacteriota bacterium]
MKIFLTGGTGFIGSCLTKKLAEKGYPVTIISRNPEKMFFLPSGVEVVKGDPTQPGSWQKIIRNHKVIINLAGFPIFCRWSRKNKKKIYDSRILTTRNIVNALSLSSPKPLLFLSASGVGYYGNRGDNFTDETAPPGDNFLAHLALDWEQEALEAKKYGVRVILCRIGMVLGKKGGALPRLIRIFRFHLKINFGSGKQWLSWINEKDLTDIFLFLINNPHLEGALNCTAPHPVRFCDFIRALSSLSPKPLLPLSIPEFILRMTLKEAADLFLNGQRVLPQKLLQEGFDFKFPTLVSALKNLQEE